MTTKHRLLAYLKENKGLWVSGESLSSRMSVSRSALWKHVRALISEGYQIESSPKKGYLFRKSPDLLFSEEIREGLTTRWLGQKEISYYTETDSTNIKARELALAGAAEGSLVIAETQTAGKGRRGRPWFSPSEHGIYLSIIVRPAIPPSETPRLVLVSSVTVAELLHNRTSLKAHIKWPNDILINKKKIAGILLEAGTDMETVDYCIVGLGLNVNNPAGSFPDVIRDSATSLSIELGRNISRTDLVREYLVLFEHYYEEFLDGRGDAIVARWKELTGIVGRRVSVDLSGRIYRGTVTDVDENGALMIRDRTGTIHRVFSGDITYRI
jgi:BirA family biotin operon repressor/biotin-[acetyl-CoA-carboxylase] ligase